MKFELLDESEEKLLQELLEHRDADYWRNRFGKIERFSDDDAMLRGTFKKLIDAGMINVLWADNFNYETDVTYKGLTYFKNKQKYQKEVFVDSAISMAKDIAVGVLSNLANKI